MPRVHADELLRERGGELNAKGIFDATLLATGSQDAAETAMCKRALEEEMRHKATG